VKQVVSLM